MTSEEIVLFLYLRRTVYDHIKAYLEDDGGHKSYSELAEESEEIEMAECRYCKHAEWDYDDFNFGGPIRQWFLVGCRKEVEDPDNCEEYEEYKYPEAEGE